MSDIIKEKYTFSFVESNPGSWTATDRDRVLRLLWYRVIQPLIDSGLANAGTSEVNFDRAQKTWAEYNTVDNEGLILFLSCGDGLLQNAEDMCIVKFVG